MRIAKRRRREGKTDYLARRKMLQGNKPRIIFRKTNRYIIVQYVLSNAAQDSVKIGLSSKDLLKYGWPKENLGGLKSITASYLIGFLMGQNIKKDKLETPIVDFGMLKTIHKNKLFGFILGLKDSGLDIKCPEEAIPSEERIKGEHLKNKISFDEIKSQIESKSPKEINK